MQTRGDGMEIEIKIDSSQKETKDHWFPTRGGNNSKARGYFSHL